VQLPFEQVCPLAQHIWPHAVVVAGHLQFPAEHVVPPVQAFPQVPQLASFVCSLMQAPLQRLCPAGQEHLPAVHEVPALQITPH
jgi:hypothetical protein